MKTTISILDPLVQDADLVAAQLGITNDELYIRAIEAFLQQHLYSALNENRSFAQQENSGSHCNRSIDAVITAKLNEVYAEVDSALDPVFQRIQWLSLPKEEW